MLKNITKEILFYCFKINNNFYLIVISILFGWMVLKIDSTFLLFNKVNKLLFQVYTHFYIRNFFGYYRLFFQYLCLKGMGYKFVSVGSYLILKLNQSHRIICKIKKNIQYFYLNKQALLIKSKSLELVKTIIFFFQKFGKMNLYKKKGVFLKGSFFVCKISSKKNKF
jgi:ribosomal protein L6P/L9E